ncbi:MAG: hypothetical protein QOE41_3420 [Mycobacterium sp.]|nr:hypothetical protein [Mycobacterium sp.]
MAHGTVPVVFVGDEAGRLTITDRIKVVIICGGETIVSSQIDVLTNHPAIAEGVVVAAPDQPLRRGGGRRARQAEDTGTAAHRRRATANSARKGEQSRASPHVLPGRLRLTPQSMMSRTMVFS